MRVCSITPSLQPAHTAPAEGAAEISTGNPSKKFTVIGDASSFKPWTTMFPEPFTDKVIGAVSPNSKYSRSSSHTTPGRFYAKSLIASSCLVIFDAFSPHRF